ncbi:pyrroline-5-carboxylate reductase [Lonepinella sp. BR2271]|uniref:pyrroline-5-carboxylate reductase n=1 Tax=Lonepinella sp. BR2271 TaxID=3434550 RepID=UPI003F6E02F9
MQQKSICFIGGGNMAQAIVFGLLKTGYPANLITVCDRNAPKRALFAEQGVLVSTDNVKAAAASDVVVLAVKPQGAAEVCSALSAVDFSQKLVISIMAAISVEKITALLHHANNVVRVMPNTPALVSQGMSGLFAQNSVKENFKKFADDLLQAVGKTCWVKDEQDMHLVTAASGSSPAYFFLFMESMQQALLKMGLTAEQARLLVQQSALGAAQMVVENPTVELATLRQNVTSKGGTTAAALNVFNEKQLEQIVEQAMQACVERSKEMEKLMG